MDAHILHFLFFGIVMMAGGGLMWYKKNRRRLACNRMKRRLSRRPSNGVPSDYLLNGIYKKYQGVFIVESGDQVYICLAKDETCIGEITCQNGILIRKWFLTAFHPKLAEFLKEFHEKEEWKAVANIMECCCQCK